MKNRIKTKIIYFLAMVIILAGLLHYNIVNAEEFQYGSSTVKYTVEDLFYVSIPETINVGSESEIYAHETNIAPEKFIYVRIEGLDSGGVIKLQNDNGTSEEINVYFMDENGERFSSENNLVAQFGSHENGRAIINSATDANPMEVSAGSYSGQVYFSIVCE